jgi:hypothetical protein
MTQKKSILDSAILKQLDSAILKNEQIIIQILELFNFNFY